MDGIKILANSVTSAQAPKVENNGQNLNEAKKLKVARDFESVLMTKVVDEMKETIQHCELSEDDGSEQVQGLFWMYLAEDVSKSGGLGLWKQVYNEMNKAGSEPKVDANI